MVKGNLGNIIWLINCFNPKIWILKIKMLICLISLNLHNFANCGVYLKGGNMTPQVGTLGRINGPPLGKGVIFPPLAYLIKCFSKLVIMSNSLSQSWWYFAWRKRELPIGYDLSSTIVINKLLFTKIITSSFLVVLFVIVAGKLFRPLFYVSLTTKFGSFKTLNGFIELHYNNYRKNSMPFIFETF